MTPFRIDRWDMRSRRGIALILAACVLGLMAVTATAFTTMASLERRSSQKRLHATRALLLARSGLEDAAARVCTGQDPSLPGTRYLGEDHDANGALGGLEFGAEITRPGILDTLTCPLAQALRPAFYVRDGASATGLPFLRKVDGRLRGCSGSPGTQGHYALKVEDESSKINVNGGLLDAGDRDVDGIPDHRDANPGAGWNAQLTRILDRLGAEVSGIPALGDTLLAARPRGGYRAMQEIQDAAAAIGIDEDLSPWITLSSWVDLQVIRPNETPAHPSETSLSRMKMSRPALALEEGGRCPVNLEAAPRPVLAALIRGLRGTCWHEDINPQSFAIPIGDVDPVLDAMVSFREGHDPLGLFASAGLVPGPFRTWERFESFCDALVPDVIEDKDYAWPGGSLLGADILKANFNPNTMSSKELPDRLRWRWIDKTDLTTWSTEGELGSTGRFRVASLARVIDANGGLLGEARAEADLEAFTLLRHTSQQDFVGNRPLAAGYLSSATVPLCRTTGASAGVAWWGGPPPGTGLALVTYPAAPPALPGGASALDGALGLATTELEPMDPLNGTLLFLHHFDDGWDADLGGSTTRADGPNDDDLCTDPIRGVWTATGTPPNTLYPDGMHGQKGTCPAYKGTGNLPSSVNDPPFDYGCLGFWLKPVTGQLQRRGDLSCMRGVPQDTQILLIGRQSGIWGINIENSISPNPGLDTTRERQFDVTLENAALPGMRRAPDLRWHLVAAHWNTGATVQGTDAYYIQRGLMPTTGTSLALGYPPFNPSNGESLLSDNTLLVMGGQPAVDPDFDRGNQIIDEVASCDFTADPDFAKAACDAWANERWLTGRYYKGDDGAFLSPLVAAGSAAPLRLLEARWTAWLPSARRMECLISEEGGMDPPIYEPRQTDWRLTKARIDLTLTDTAGAPLRPLVHGAPLDLTLPGFRYRARFVNDLAGAGANPVTEPVLETPYLEDVTFAIQSSEGPRVTAWSER